MTQWARAPQRRDQLVLFPERLDDAIAPGHTVRLLNDILDRIDWSRWEAGYHLNRGQPAIHPRVLAGVLLYGLLTRIRSSRALEDALQVRLDFRWLAEGRTIDHTTLSEFRRKHGEQLKDLFVQTGLVARQMGQLSLAQLAFDGTRIRANNRRRGARTPEELRTMRAELAAKCAELEAQAVAEDARDEELLGDASRYQLPSELADTRRRQDQVEAALAEIERLTEAGETVPARLPMTDPESRIMPNKEGGFAPNYTPTATVDVESGLLVDVDVLQEVNEDQHLVESIQQVQQQFGLAEPPPEALADGLMATGANLSALEEQGITLYSPVAEQQDNPAVRDDPRQPVPPEAWDQLPTRRVNRGGQKSEQLDKSAFVYDAEEDCYRCPQGEALTYSHTTREQDGKRQRIRHRYQADENACAGCPLRELCLQGRAKRRQINREQHEAARERHARRMATPEAKQKYARRLAAGERPFAVIKQQFGARQFLLRGIDRVRTEFTWLATAHNMLRLIGMQRSGTGPPPPAAC